MNKKAVVGTQLTVIWFAFIVLVIVVGVVAGVYLFFGGDYDYRSVDARLLNYRITDCILEKNITLNNQTFATEFYQKCPLNKNLTEKNYFIKIESPEGLVYETGPGDTTQCALSDKNINYPRCHTFWIVKNNKAISIETGDNQRSRKLP